MPFLDILSLAFSKLILVIYFIDVLFLLYFGLHTYIMVYLYIKNYKHCIFHKKIINNSQDLSQNKWPQVTIQLPVFNEYFVIERLIDSVVNLDYPKNKLHIQVLDDSTDDSVVLAQKKVQYYKKKGFSIEHIHRTNRIGHKAGALKAGLKKIKGEFVAILDADFIPSKDFLKKAIPYFYTDNNIGMVQTRWGHINTKYSFLTKAQSIGIDGHFMIEQVARNGSKLWMNFNGTAGIWRKACILDSGNWQSDTLTEDFDLSYRAELAGWQFKYLSNVVCDAELPVTIQAYKSQQFRWCKGSLQTALKLIPSILKSKESWKIKVEALTHLLNYSVHPLMLINMLLVLPMMLFNDNILYMKSSVLLLIGFTFIMLGALGPNILYIISQRSLYSDWKKRIIWLPFMVLLGIGIAINNTKAWLEAVLGKKSTFIRTPKLGITDKVKKAIDLKKYKQNKLSFLIFIELFFVGYLTYTIFYAVQRDMLFMIPILGLYVFSFIYIIYLSFSNIKLNQNEEAYAK